MIIIYPLLGTVKTFWLIFNKIFGTAYRNRTHIHTLEECCILHYTKAVYSGGRLRNRTPTLASRSAFETVLSPAQIIFQCLVEWTGIEPAERPRSSTNLAHYKTHYTRRRLSLKPILVDFFLICFMVDHTGIEPAILTITPHCLAERHGIEP